MAEIFQDSISKKGKHEVIKGMKQSLERIDLIMERLAFDQENKPLRLLGFAVTNGLLKTIYSFFFSAIIFGGQIYF